MTHLLSSRAHRRFRRRICKYDEQKGERFRAENTHFQNPTGLPAKDHYSTANDMAIMARELMKYPLIRKYTGKYEDYLREDTDKKFWLVNTNKLVRFILA